MSETVIALSPAPAPGWAAASPSTVLAHYQVAELGRRHIPRQPPLGIHR